MKGIQIALLVQMLRQILLNGLILPIGEASAVKGLRLQPAQQACFLDSRDNVPPPNSTLLFKSFVTGTERGSGLRSILLPCCLRPVDSL